MKDGRGEERSSRRRQKPLSIVKHPWWLCYYIKSIFIDQGHCHAGKAAVVMLRGWWAKRTHKNLGLLLCRSTSGPWALEECQGCGVLLGRARKSPKVLEKQLTGVMGSFGHDSPDKEEH